MFPEDVGLCCSLQHYTAMSPLLGHDFAGVVPKAVQLPSGSCSTAWYRGTHWGAMFSSQSRYVRIMGSIVSLRMVLHCLALFHIVEMCGVQVDSYGFDMSLHRQANWLVCGQQACCQRIRCAHDVAPLDRIQKKPSGGNLSCHWANSQEMQIPSQ